jgi:diacylglycerol kinase family enzyme
VRRALLVVNPAAFRVTPTARRAVAGALAAGYRVEEAETGGPGGASDVARRAVADGTDLLVVLGGDGTVNEVANAVAGTDQTVAVLSGGMANVFARAIGGPPDPVEGARALAASTDEARAVPLGRIGDRWFVANAGVGFDAAVVRRVEAHQRAKRRAGDWYFVWEGLRTFSAGYDRRHPHLELTWGDGPGERRNGLFLAIAQNLDPYTFLGRRPLRLCPRAALDGGLDLVALERFSLADALPIVLRAFGRARPRERPHVLSLHDRGSLHLVADRPVPVQADGEYLGERSDLVLESVPGALRLLG